LGRPVDHDQVLVGHVTDQDADDAERKAEPCGDLGDGQDVVAESGDGPLLTVSFGVCSPMEVGSRGWPAGWSGANHAQ
jgi:hypothetical protein